jgi:hypothetical protein
MKMNVSCRVPEPPRYTCAAAPGHPSRTCEQPSHTVRQPGDCRSQWYLSRCHATPRRPAGLPKGSR